MCRLRRVSTVKKKRFKIRSKSSRHLSAAVPETCCTHFFLQISLQVGICFFELVQRILKHVVMQNTILIPEENSNSLPCRTSVCVIMYMSYKLLKTVLFLAHCVYFVTCLLSQNVERVTFVCCVCAML